MAEKKAVYELSVFGDDEKEYKCQLSSINRDTLEIVMAMVAPSGNDKPKYLTAGELILNTCWISGDAEIRTDEQLKISASMAAIKLFELKKTSLKKL